MRLFGIPLPSFVTSRLPVQESQNNRFFGGQLPQKSLAAGPFELDGASSGLVSSKNVHSWPFAGSFDAYEDAGQMTALLEPQVAQMAGRQTNAIHSWPFAGLQDYYEDSGWVAAGAEAGLGFAVIALPWPAREISGPNLSGGARHGDRSELDMFSSSLDPQYRWDGNRLIYGEDRQRWGLEQPILPTIYV